jgi:hypothetical protein
MKPSERISTGHCPKKTTNKENQPHNSRKKEGGIALVKPVTERRTPSPFLLPDVYTRQPERKENLNGKDCRRDPQKGRGLGNKVKDIGHHLRLRGRLLENDEVI